MEIFIRFAVPNLRRFQFFFSFKVRFALAMYAIVNLILRWFGLTLGSCLSREIYLLLPDELKIVLYVF